MLAGLVSVVTCLALAGAPVNPQRQGPAPTTDLKPVIVAVVDSVSGKPVTAFRYQAWYHAPGRQSRPRKPMFRVDLTPVSNGPLSFARPDLEELNEQRNVVLPDVGPGKYRLRVYDWLGRRGLESGPLSDREVVAPPGGGGKTCFELGVQLSANPSRLKSDFLGGGVFLSDSEGLR